MQCMSKTNQLLLHQTLTNKRAFKLQLHFFANRNGHLGGFEPGTVRFEALNIPTAAKNQYYCILCIFRVSQKIIK